MAEHREAHSNGSAVGGLIGALASSLLVYFPIGIVLVTAMWLVGGSTRGAVVIALLWVGYLALWATNVWLWASSRKLAAVWLSAALAAAMLILVATPS